MFILYIWQFVFLVFTFLRKKKWHYFFHSCFLLKILNKKMHTGGSLPLVIGGMTSNWRVEAVWFLKLKMQVCTIKQCQTNLYFMMVCDEWSVETDKSNPRQSVGTCFITVNDNVFAFTLKLIKCNRRQCWQMLKSVKPSFHLFCLRIVPGL